MKECTTCSEIKPLVTFKAYFNGYCLKYKGSCKDCHNSEERGTLCHHCNTALGLPEEDTTRLDKMKEYINAYK